MTLLEALRIPDKGIPYNKMVKEINLFIKEKENGNNRGNVNPNNGLGERRQRKQISNSIAD